MPNPTNEILAEKIDSFRALVEEKFKHNDEAHNVVNKHLSKLNGQVAKNTLFRARGGVYIGLVAIAISTGVTLFITKLFE